MQTIARHEYPHATRGDVWRVLGWLWPWCPAWWVTYSSPAAREMAEHVIDLARLARAGLSGTIGDELTPVGVDLVTSVAIRLWDSLQSQHERELIEAQRKEMQRGR